MLARYFLIALTCQAVIALSTQNPPPRTLDCTTTCPNIHTQNAPQWPRCASHTTTRPYWYLTPLGHGSSSSVLKATLIPPHLLSRSCLSPPSPAFNPAPNLNPSNPNTTLLAIKILDRKDEDESQEVYVRAIKQEYEVMRALASHPNIVQAWELLEEDGRWKMVLEHCEDSLTNRLKMDKLSKGGVLEVWRKVFDAARYMHNMGIAHRDLKAENVLFCSGVPKLADFGSAIKFRDEQSGALLWSEDIDGTKPYIAPEVWLGRYNTSKADVWQLGILLASIFMRKFPWDTAKRSDKKFIEFVKNPERLFTEMPMSFRLLLGRMLVLDPGRRADLEEIWGMLG